MGNCKKAIAPLLILFMLIIASAPCDSQSQATKVIAISAGTFHSATICDDGTVWTWGDNRWGQLGDGTNMTRLSPVQVPINDVKAISAGFDFTVALKNDGTVWAWGDNHYGQLGDGTNKNSYIPIQVKGLSKVKAIAAGGGHVLALKEDGTVWAWGRGFRGQLGIDGVNPVRDNNDTYNLYTPTQVSISNVIAISAGAFHSAALKADGTVPLYHDGIVYVPVSNGIVALDRNGNELWSKRFDFDGFRLFELMPVDVEDNVYLACYNLTYPTINEATDIYMIDRNGTLVMPPRTLKICYDGAMHSSAKDGIVYNIDMDWDKIGRSTRLDDIATVTVRAYDIKGDRYLWNYTVPTEPRYAAVLDANNVYTLFDRPTADLYVKGGIGQSNTAAPQTIGATWIDTYPTDDTLYINFKSVRHEWPVVLGETQCLYASGVYALDTSGFVVCQKPVGSIVTAMTVNNSTVYYSTGDGGISAMPIGLVASVMVVMAAFILLVGYIARSRSKLDKNKNRTATMEYVSRHPGSTLYEISRGMGLNKGTVRYHLFILGMNHRLVSYNDGKFVRYFTNSGTFSKEERMLISLIRRDTMKKVLRALLEKPGTTSAEMGKALGQPDSAVRKHLNELCARGIAARKNISDSRYAYSIKAEYAAQVESLMKSLGSENASVVSTGCPAEA